MAKRGVRSSEGKYFVQSRDGRELFINEAGMPIAPLLPGWHADSVVDALDPILLLNLRHEGGSQATWVLDTDMQRIALSVRELGGPMREVLHERAVALMRLVIRTVLAAAVPTPSTELDGFERMQDDALTQIVDLSMQAVMSTVSVAGLIPAENLAARGQSAEIILGLKLADLAATLSGSIPQDCRELLATGEMRCAAPDGTGSVSAQLGMILLDRLTAYRYVSPRVGVFYILTRDYHQTRSALYIPSLSFFGRMDDGPDARTVVAVMLLHVFRHHAQLIRCLALPPESRRPLTFVSDFPKIHIGHVIWNELSGLEELVSCLPQDALPDVMVINAEHGSEPFGRIDTLFPEYAGKVKRPDISWNDAAAYVYEQNAFFMRYMTRFVRRSVGERILRHVREDGRLGDDRQLACRIGPPKQVCVLLGIRVGNRTLRDQTGFLVAAIEHLMARLGRITIVLEGTNSRVGYDPSTTFGGFKLPGSEEPIIEELRIVFAIRERFHNRQVDIVSTAGCPLASSLFWTQQCRFFIAPWGAALAKYRWVCNLPGFVVTNKYNIGQPVSDLPIYHSEEFNETPTSMSFVPLEAIQDAPGPAGFYANFDIALPALYDGIDELIARTAP